MTITIDWEVKQQNKQKLRRMIREVSGLCLSVQNIVVTYDLRMLWFMRMSYQ